MKKAFLIFVAALAAFAVGYWISGQRWHRHYAREIQRLQEDWQQQMASAVASASAAGRSARAAEAPAARPGVGRALAPETRPSSKPTPAAGGLPVGNPREILARIQELQQNGGPGSQRLIQGLLGDLVLAGPESLEVIREFLAQGEDVKWDAQGKGKGPGGGGSLRRELLQVAREIGGEGAEQLLAQTLSQAAGPQEMLWLAQVLEKMAPGKYQQAAVTAATAQLASLAGTGGDPGPYLEILGMYGDRSYLEKAQAMVLQEDGRLNKDALDYLHQVLQQDVLPLAQQLWQDPRLSDPKAREELGKLAVEYVGLSEQANQLWYQSALNAELPDKTRERLVRELEKKGFQDPKNPTPQDVELAQVRLQILEAVRAQVQGTPQLVAIEETRLRLAAMVDPNLRQSLPNPPKPNKMPR